MVKLVKVIVGGQCQRWSGQWDNPSSISHRGTSSPMPAAPTVARSHPENEASDVQLDSICCKGESGSPGLHIGPQNNARNLLLPLRYMLYLLISKNRKPQITQHSAKWINMVVQWTMYLAEWFPVHWWNHFGPASFHPFSCHRFPFSKIQPRKFQYKKWRDFSRGCQRYRRAWHLREFRSFPITFTWSPKPGPNLSPGPGTMS